ncbi:hypothetical protein NDI52_28920 [Leptolyngbya sp. PL-A3]|uniref:hypothetical protein n=1 Tax=Leptolyngbya sp. PL-A3 TaxID=2933911 RepID=UPI0032985BD8
MANNFDAQREIWTSIYANQIPEDLRARFEALLAESTPKAAESLRNVMAIEYEYAGLTGAIAYVDRVEASRLNKD